MDYINELFDKYYDSIMLYLVIICMASLTAKLSYKRKNGAIRYSRFWLIISFVILVCFLGFARVGTDYEQYRYIFINSTNMVYWQSTRIEKGYLLFNSLIRLFTSNFEVFHFLWAFVMLWLIYSTVAKYKEIFNPGWSILAYTTIFMLQSLDLMRMYFAIAIIFWGVRYIINKNFYAYLLVIVVASLFHKSSLCILIPYAIWFVMRKEGKYWLKSMCIFVMFMTIYVLRESIFDGTFLGYGYAARTTGTLGFGWIIYHLPIIFLIVYYLVKYKRKSDDFLNVMFIFLAVSSGMWMLSYFVDAFGRITFYFTYPFVIIPSYLFNKMEDIIKNSQVEKVNKSSLAILRFSILKFIFIIYYFFRWYMLLEYLETDNIGNYITIFM